MLDYIPLIITALGLIVSVTYNFYYKNKYDDKKTLIEKRFSVYKEYLSQTDIFNLNAFTRKYINEYRNEMIKLMESTMYCSTLQNMENCVRFAAWQSNTFLQWKEEWNKQLDNTNAIKLVCSKKVHKLLEEYIKFSKEQVIIQFENILDPAVIFGGPASNAVNNMIKNKNIDKLQEIKAKLEMAMREDIGNI